MTQNTTLSHTSPGIAKIAPRMVVGLSSAFIGILVLLHFLEPEFDPSWRMISEYELGQYGWMMSAAFFCWGGSVLSLLVVLWPALGTRAGRIGRWWMLLIGIVLFGAGIFITNPITDPTPRTANTLHTLCGAIVILTFPIAASLVARSLFNNPEWKPVGRLTWITLLVWFAVIAYFGSIIISRVINPAAGRVGPEVLQGWPNRFMVVVYNLWLIVVALRADIKSRTEAR